ncbi:unnamed protein product [Allacma fusca]|uniref:Uncharacterized protein n=1 Tax=Allacma fusca TaxID=39272 RepID=A0A8J2NSF5_9HEXA|nr:unnamed protein product [Allacma fusca]
MNENQQKYIPNSSYNGQLKRFPRNLVGTFVEYERLLEVPGLEEATKRDRQYYLLMPSTFSSTTMLQHGSVKR